MFNWLKRMNTKYDNVPEPKRMFIMLAILLPGIILTTSSSVIVSWAGGIWLLLNLAVRMAHIHKWL